MGEGGGGGGGGGGSRRRRRRKRGNTGLRNAILRVGQSGLFLVMHHT
jgi:hypothetical protein